MRTVGINELSQKKRAQLRWAIRTKPMYISVENYSYDKTAGAYFYTIELGEQCGSMVNIRRVSMRYSQLYDFDRTIRPNFKDCRFLLNFPPKKIFGNKEATFLEKRFEQIQMYMGNLIRVPGVCDTDVFKSLFIDV